MSTYQSSYTGAQIDSLLGAVNTAVGQDGIVNVNGLNTTLENYIPLNSTENTGVFLRGDNTWSDTINGNILKITNSSNTVTIGSQNSGFCHIYNSADIPFIFNKTICTTAGSLGSSTYPWNNLYIGQANGAGIYYVGTQSSYRMIRFIDNTADVNGNGISIGGGGATIIGGGESADAAANQLTTGGSEIMYVCNDGDVNIFTNMQSGWASRYTFTFTNTGMLNNSSVKGGTWIAGSHDACFKVTAATTASAGGFYQGWFSGKTPSGAWSLGCLSGNNDLYFVYGTDANYNASTNSTVNARISTAGAFVNASKRELKEHIQPFEYSGLEIINSTKICSFNMKADENKDYRVGFIADDTNPIISGKNQDVMDLQNCIGVLMKAVQELSAEIQSIYKHFIPLESNN